MYYLSYKTAVKNVNFDWSGNTDFVIPGFFKIVYKISVSIVTIICLLAMIEKWICMFLFLATLDMMTRLISSPMHKEV